MSRQNVRPTEPTLSLQGLCIVGTVIANPTALQHSLGLQSPETFAVTLQTLAKAQSPELKKNYVYIYYVTLHYIYIYIYI